MGTAFSYNELSVDAVLCASAFFGDDGLKDLFCELFRQMKRIESSLVIRGKHAEILGISKPGDRYLFYIVPVPNAFFIKFRSHLKTPFETGRTPQYLSYALSELGGYADSSAEYSEGTDNQSSLVNAEPEEKSIPDKEFSPEPFFKVYHVIPEDFRDVEITHSLFSNRAFNCLMRAGISTIEMLLNSNEEELAKTPYLGRKTMKEILYVLQATVIKDECLQQSINDSIASTKIAPSNSIAAFKGLNRDKCKMIRDSVYQKLKSAASVKPPVLGSEDEGVSFCSFLENWTADMLESIPNLDDRNRSIFIQRIVYGETLGCIGKSAELSRERVRQICNKITRRVSTRVKRYPDSRMIDLFLSLNSYLDSKGDANLAFLLHYTLEKRKHLLSFSLSIISTDDQGSEILALLQTNTLQKMQQTSDSVPQMDRQRIDSEPPPRPVEGRACPQCGSALVIRTSKRGNKAGEQFIGCSKFPKCWYSEPLNSMR